MTPREAIAHLMREVRHLEAKCKEADEKGDPVESAEAKSELKDVQKATSYLRPQSSTDAKFLAELIEGRAQSMIDDGGNPNALIRIVYHEDVEMIRRIAFRLIEWFAAQEQQREAA
jgi:hypothetical protein